ncbi:hypothetical protein GLGR_2614 [Leminorella grimontii ATCC 33999 = DSM 5078]|nr:hypothetical protein GLGR_2614 [Leminorella grimontii ATCC 33999 = DSM 5078]
MKSYYHYASVLKTGPNAALYNAFRSQYEYYPLFYAKYFFRAFSKGVDFINICVL